MTQPAPPPGALDLGTVNPDYDATESDVWISPKSHVSRLKPYIDRGWLPPDAGPQDVYRLSQGLLKQGFSGLSRGQAAQGILPANPDDIKGAYHPVPRGENALDKEATKVIQQYIPSYQQSQRGVERDPSISSGSMQELRERDKTLPAEVPATPPLSSEKLAEYGLGPAAETPPPGTNQEGLGVSSESTQPSTDLGSSGGSYSASYSAQGNPFEDQLRKDYDEQLQGMQAEGEAREGDARGQAASLGQLADYKRGMAYDMQQDAHRRSAEAYAHMNDIAQLTKDYAEEKIDPYKLTKDMSWNQKIGTLIGAMATGFAGGPEAANKYINNLVDRSIALQQEQIQRHGRALYESDNLFNNFMKVSGNEEEAVNKSRAVLFDAAMTDSQKAAVEAGIPIKSAQMQQFMASLKMQRDMALAKIHAAVSGRGNGSGGSGSLAIPIEGASQVVTLPNGQEIYIGRGGEDVSKAISTSSRASEEAKELNAYMDKRPDFVSSPLEYQNWHAGLRQRLKSLSVLEAQHLGQGSRSSLGLLQVYKQAIAGPDNNETTFAGPVDAARMAYQAEQIKGTTKTLAEQADADMNRILQVHSGIVGQTVLEPVREKGQQVIKPMFQPGPARKPIPSAAQQGQPDPFKNFKPSGK